MYASELALPTAPLPMARVMQWLAVAENEALFGVARARAGLVFKRPFDLESCQAYGRAGLAVMVPSWLMLVLLHSRSLKSLKAIDRSLEEGLGARFFETIRLEFGATLMAGAPLSSWVRPSALHDRERVVRVRNIAYGPAIELT